MGMEDQEVEARSDAGKHAVGSWQVHVGFIKKTKSFWPSSIVLGAGETGEVWGMGKHKKAKVEH